MNKPDKPLPFDKKNYVYMLIGIVTIFLGYLLMSLDGEPHGYGFLGLTLGPIVLLLGFAIEFYAILYKEKSKERE